MAITRVTTWNTGDTLTASALNDEFDNLADNVGAINAAVTVSGVWTFSSNPVFNTNAIAWAKVSKSGSDLGDLSTRDAADLTTNLGIANKVLAVNSGGTAPEWAWEILDEDNMASDSATSLATQQSIKAYADSVVGAASIGGLSDVTITTVADNEVLQYDNGTGQWINQTFAEAGIQAQGDVLDDLNTLGAASADGEFIVATGAGAFAYESGATVRTSLGLTVGSDVQAFGAVLDDFNTLGAAASDGQFIVATGAGAFAYESGATARSSLGLGSIATQASSSVSITGGSIAGITDLAIADGGTGASSAATAFSNLKQAASTTASGVAELATTAETTTGTDTGRVVTPDGLAGSIYGTKVVEIAVVDTGTALATGDGQAYFVVPVELNGMNLVSVGAHVFTASSSGTPTVQIHNATDAADMLSTAITIDANEKDSKDATAAASINGAADDVVTGDEIRIDVDAAGTGTRGLSVRLGFRTP